MSHLAVLEAAVVGKPHPVDIEHMTAYVVKKPGHEVTEKKLQSYVDGALRRIFLLCVSYLVGSMSIIGFRGGGKGGPY